MRTDSFRDFFGYLHLGVIAFLDVFQGNLNVSASTRHTGRDKSRIRYDGVDQCVDFFRIVTDVFIAGSFGRTGPDVDLRAVFQWGHLGWNMVP